MLNQQGSQELPWVFGFFLLRFAQGQPTLTQPSRMSKQLGLLLDFVSQLSPKSICHSPASVQLRNKRPLS